MICLGAVMVRWLALWGLIACAAGNGSRERHSDVSGKEHGGLPARKRTKLIIDTDIGGGGCKDLDDVCAVCIANVRLAVVCLGGWQ